ncbi:TPA: restriction endonuclease subunit S [Legionella pneumophila]|uniref:restriction endonuclease subunit S n=1 Tax=Legionella pneumophila TaxID=446 RepID=UPI00078817FF|nr:restriction endonuclease subunit S [Legionella pneumophila]HAU1193386.1 restriction endonuclease subunit S [Legionella pneumophila]HBD7102793.1 restriction endonuclease subunit S [Legionella pneumophila]HCO4740214.1 restriction endonuclease subunit S [Legionella pneumophila]HEG4430783.1 restriction endonuclease subunit S [Legionella pneumophila]HEG4433170.1 restriction endonuclease subunit S [Legionella pneumophila]
MANINVIDVSQAVIENRFSAEFFDPTYSFIPKNENSWIKIGRILKQCQYGISISMNETGKGYPIYRMNELDNCFALRPAKYANISKKEYSTFQLNKKDILFNRTNSFDFVGRTGIYLENSADVFASYLIRIVPNENYILPEYLTIYLNTEFGIGQIKRRAMRSINQANVSASELKQILIFLADMSFQQDIAKLVNNAYQKRRLSKSLYTQAQELLEKELGLDQLVLEKSMSYEASFSEVVNHGIISSYFYQPKYKQLHNLIMDKSVILHKLVENYSSGFAFTKSHISKHKTQNKLIKINNITENGIDLMNADSLNNNGILAGKNEIAELGDILIGMSGTIGITGIVRDNATGAYINQRIFRIKPRGISSEYLALILNSIVGKLQFERVCTGGVQSNISSKDILKVLIPRLDAKEDKIMELVKLSFQAAKESEQLLALAKNRVEDLIEGAAK